MKLFLTLFAVGACLLSAGCANKSATPNVVLYAGTGALTQAILAATQYEALPTCRSGGPTVCSDPATVARIQVAAQTAVAADLAAQTVVTDKATSSAAKSAAVAQASAALAALTQLTPAAR